jgi:hypothetical protein
MTQQVARPGPFAEYLGHFDGLIGDKRTREIFGEIVRGIINAGSLGRRATTRVMTECQILEV